MAQIIGCFNWIGRKFRLSAPATTILELNDDCLLEVFNHLDIADLCAVSDVCRRFRKYAKLCFDYSNKTDLCLGKEIKGHFDCGKEEVSVAILHLEVWWCVFVCRRHYYIKKCRKRCYDTLAETTKILRHFGSHFTKFDEGGTVFGHYDLISPDGARIEKSRIKLLKLIIRYCSGTLTDFSIHKIVINNEMLTEIRPLIEGLEKLALIDCQVSQAFWNLLPLRSPELRELKISRDGYSRRNPELSFDFLKYHKKLLKISLSNFYYLTNESVAKMLVNNPQLKEIQLIGCSQVDSRILLSIACCTVNVETLVLYGIQLRQEHALYFGLLKNLKSLTMGRGFADLQTFLPAMQHIAAANIPLKHLNLNWRKGHRINIVDELVDEILKLKKLESLTCCANENLHESHIYKFCQYLPELRDLRLVISMKLQPKDITEWIRAADKLEKLYINLSSDNRRFDESMIIVDSGTYMEWIEIVENRRDKTFLFLSLDDICFEAELTPADRKGIQCNALQKNRFLVVEMESNYLKITLDQY